MKIVCLGSVNIDRVYGVQDFVREGATISAATYEEFPGGKGMNQSAALGRAGAEVWHLGCIGSDGIWLKKLLEQTGVHTENLQQIPGNTGHAVIQVDQRGKNCIIVVAGTNGCVTQEQISRSLENFRAGDMLLTQNETSGVSFAMKTAKKKGMKIAFNPSPVTEEMLSYPLELVDYLILNETEAGILAQMDADSDPEQMITALLTKYPDTTVVLTLGGKGVVAGSQDRRWQHQAYCVQTVDTTAAGDTFCGFLLAALSAGNSMEYALRAASRAAALAVTKQGAMPSIPAWEEMEKSPLLPPMNK